MTGMTRRDLEIRRGIVGRREQMNPRGSAVKSVISYVRATSREHREVSLSGTRAYDKEVVRFSFAHTLKTGNVARYRA